ncbi:MAG: flagellar FlbD family protein [Jatrophihabitantaceae bacterium]
MLQLTRLSGPVFALNPDLIERAEATPDTVVTLVNGSRYVIRESLEELTELIRDYRADIISAAQVPTEYRHPPRPKDATPRPTVVALRNGER